MDVIGVFNVERATAAEVERLRPRDAVRGVIVDAEGHVALLDNVKRNGYSVPGGVEAGETFEEALIRECREEIACDVRIIGEIGTTIESYAKRGLVNRSHAYLVSVIGQKGVLIPTGDEAEVGSDVIRVPIEEAMSRVQSTVVEDHESIGYSVIVRDTAILKRAQEMLDASRA